MEPTKNKCKITPIGKNSELIYKNRSHALIGVSPFNSYFSEENITSIIQWAKENFEKINIFIPDNISIYTLKAAGYSQERAAFKTKRQDAYLKNKVFRALKKLNFYDENTVIFLSDLMHNEAYIHILTGCLSLFKNDPCFNAGCLSTSAWILSKNNKTQDAESVNHAVQYFLYEMPLFLNTPNILGLSSSLFVYNSIPKYLENVYKESNLVSHTQGFLKLDII